ncbi:hypothetical protein A6R68_15371, partial [Neotoma lepida]
MASKIKGKPPKQPKETIQPLKLVGKTVLPTKQVDQSQDILDEQQKLFQQFQVIPRQKIEKLKELCNRHL